MAGLSGKKVLARFTGLRLALNNVKSSCADLIRVSTSLFQPLQGVDRRHKTMAVRLIEIGCTQGFSHNLRSPWPGSSRPSTPYRQATEPPSKTWVAGSRPATGTVGCSGALWYLLTAAVKSGTGQPWHMAGQDDIGGAMFLPSSLRDFPRSALHIMAI
jgi:hypothetical protein